MLSPTIQMDSPNEPILLYDNVAIVRYDRYEMRAVVQIYQSWFPYDRVEFKFSLSSIPAVWLDLVLDALNKNVEIQINHDWTWVGVLYGIKEVDEGVTFTGSVRTQIVISTSTLTNNIKMVDFSLFNFRTYAGSKIETALNSGRLGELKFATTDHSLIIHSIKSEAAQKEEQKSVGGYLLTNSGRIEFKDECSPERSKFLLRRLGVFLSFLNGRRSYPRYIKAYNDKHELLWEDYTPYLVSQYKHVLSWMPSLIKEKEMTHLWSNFLSITNSDQSLEKIDLIIHWYLEALNNSGFTKGSILMVQTTFEILYSWLVEEKKMVIPYTNKNQHRASNKIRTLLKHFELHLGLPKVASDLVADIRLLDKEGNEKVPPHDFSYWYTEIRNLFVHFSEIDSINRKKLPKLFDWYLLNTAIFNLEVILLKMMDYNGSITSRLQLFERKGTKQVHISSPY